MDPDLNFFLRWRDRDLNPVQYYVVNTSASRQIVPGLNLGKVFL